MFLEIYFRIKNIGHVLNDIHVHIRIRASRKGDVVRFEKQNVIIANVQRV